MELTLGRPGLRRLSSLVTALLASVLASSPASASVGGTAHSLLRSYRVQGSANTTGASLMLSNSQVNYQLLTESSGNLTGFPADGVVDGAFLFWSGSADPAVGADPQIRLVLPNGEVYPSLRIDRCESGETPCDLSANRCVVTTTPTVPLLFYSCRRDVTGLMGRVTGTGGPLTFSVGDVAAQPGTPDNFNLGGCAMTDPFCQAKYAGWSLVVAWYSESSTVTRDAVLYDGFYYADEDYDSGGTSGVLPIPLVLSGFSAKSGARAELSFFALEGDAQLGVPPQDTAPYLCPTCTDWMEISTPSHGAWWRVTDGSQINPPGNLFNSSNKNGGTTVGVDLDTFSVGLGGSEQVVGTGDTTMNLRFGSGDGAVGGNFGGGELFFLGYVFLALDTDAPRLNNVNTVMMADLAVASPGQTITYTVRVTNDGTANATNVLVRTPTPNNVTYIPNTTTNTCGVSSADVGGRSPVENGLNIGTLTPAGPRRQCEVRFQVRVNAGTPTGTQIRGVSTLSADNVRAFTREAITNVQANLLTRLEKTVSGTTGGAATPGSTLTYTLTAYGNGSASVSGVSLTDVLDANLQGLAVTQRPAGSAIASDANTGRVQVTGITVPANGTATVQFTARLVATAVDGASVPNQAQLAQPDTATPLNSDDPATPTAADATVVRVLNRIDLTASTLTVVAPADGTAAPGEEIRWRIHVTNNGNRTGTITLADDLPANVTGCTLVTAPAGVVCAPGGANGTSRVTGTFTLAPGASVDIEFRTAASITAPNGTSIGNRATLTPAEIPAAAFTLNAAAVLLVNQAALSITKSVQDLNGLPTRPFETVRYSMVVTNTGNLPATNLAVVDSVDTRLTITAVGQGGTNSNWNLLWTATTTPALATLNPNQSVTLTFDATVPMLPTGVTIDNLAYTRCDEAPTAVASNTATITVTSAPVLSLSKTVQDLNGGQYRPGDTVRYTLTVRNTGDFPARSVTVLDPVDAALRFVSASNGGTLGSNVVAWNLGNLNPGSASNVTLTFDAQLRTPLDNGQVVSNQGGVSSGEFPTPILSDDPSLPGASDPTRFTVVASPLVTLTKTATDDNGAPLNPSDQVTYTLTLTNTGDAAARNVTVEDVADARLTSLAAQNSGTVSGQRVTWSYTTAPWLQSVVPGVPVTLRFTARVVSPMANGTVIPNQASASSSTAATVLSDDPGTPAANDPTVVTVVSQARLVITKRVANLTHPGLPVYAPGDRVQYDLVFTNAGTETATNLVITDVLPATLSNIDALPSGRVTGQTVVWDSAGDSGLRSVAPGATDVRRVSGTIVRPLDNGTLVSNSATLAADGMAAVPSDDPDTTPVGDPTVFRVTSLPSLKVTKTVLDSNGPPFAPGDPIQYTITVTNVGTSASLNTVIQDAVDVRLDNVTASNSGVISNGSVRWDAANVPILGSLAPDASATVTLSAVIHSPLDDGTSIPNQAVVHSLGIADTFSDDPNTPAVNDSTVLRVTSDSDLSVSTKEVLNGAGTRVTEAAPGAPLVYRITVSNRGTASALNVVVEDPLPAEWLTSSVENNGAVVNGVLTWDSVGEPNLAQVRPGQTVVLQVHGALRVPLDDGTAVANQARVYRNNRQGAPFLTDDPATPVFGDSTRVIARSRPELAGATKTYQDVNGGLPEPGDTIVYTVNVQNRGTAAARSVVVTDVVDTTRLQVDSVGEGGVLNNGTITWNSAGTPALLSLAPSNTPTALSFTARVLPTLQDGAVIANQADVSASGVAAVKTDDPATPALADPTAFTIHALPHLVLEKSLPAGAPRVVAPLTQVTYALSLTNTGSAVATGVRLRDELPPNVTFVSATAGGTLDALTRSVQWTLPDLTPFGGESRVEVVVSVDELAQDGEVLANRAFGVANNVTEVGSDDPATPAAGDPTVVTVTARVDLSAFTKVAVDENQGTLLPGEILLYRITVPNTGTTAAHDVSVTDQLDPVLEIVEVRQGGTVAGNLVTWSGDATAALRRLRPSDPAVVLEVRARVKAGTADATRISNQAFVRSAEVAATPSDDPATAAPDDPTVVSVSAPRLVFTKEFQDMNGAPTVPGDAVRFRLGLENRGSAPATTVVVTDELQAGLQDVVLGQGGTLTGRVARWDSATTAALAAIYPATRVELTVDARVDPFSSGDQAFSNQAFATAPALGGPVASDDPRTPEPDATRFVLQGAPDFTESSLTVENTPAVVRPRDALRFIVTLRNSGTAVAKGAALTADLDPNLINLRAEEGGAVVGQRVSWTATSLPALALLRPGDTAVVHVKADVRWPLPDGTHLQVVAHATALEIPQAVTIGPVNLVVSSQPRLSASALEMTDVNSGELEPGDLVTYRLTVLNDGSASAHQVRVSFPVPSGAQYLANSTTLGGVRQGDVGGTTALATETLVGDLDPGAAVIATYQVRAQLNLPRGYRVSGQAWLRAAELTLVPSDDPRTPEILGDPTEAVVGGGANLAVQLTAEPAVTGVDGVSTLRLALENAGSRPARDVLALVPIPAGAEVLPGSLTINGASITDAPDADDGGWEPGGWWIRVANLESGDARVATARIRLKGEAGRAEFQAQVTRPGTPVQLSDSDLAAAGAQTTLVTRSGGAPDLGGSSKSLVDINGGEAEPGDELLFTIRLSNRGASDATLRTPDGFLDALDSRLRLVDGSLEPVDLLEALGDPARLVLKQGASVVLKAGESLTIRFRARIAASTPLGTEVRNTAVAVLADGTRTNLGPVAILVGSVPGTADLQGTVFEDVGAHNRTLDGGQDRPLKGFQVLLVPLDAGARATPVATALSDEQGHYRIPSLAPGEYRARVVSPGGAQFAEHHVSALRGGERRVQDLSVDPSGVIYDARSFAPLRGVTATLYADNGDDDITNDMPLAEDDLPAGQQRQVTGEDGRYRFDPRPGRYRIALSGPSPTSVWPSSVYLPANDDNSANPFGSWARTDADGNVVPDAVPAANSNHRYYLRFDLPSADKPVFHNHIPIDPLASHVQLQKLASKRVANVGDIITYTVRVVSTAPQDMTLTSMGGVEVADSIPAGFKLVPGSMRVERLVRDTLNRSRRERVNVDAPKGNRLLVMGPFDLLGQSETEVRYQLVVGPSVKFGPQVNHAVLRSARGQVDISNGADATVEIRPEPVLDQGNLVGKVFCDQNGNGWQDKDEPGLFGVRVYLDSGYLAETDEFGRFHYSTINPGTHLAKIDVRTLPPGARLSTLERQSFYVTRGLPSRISFGAVCMFSTATTPSVAINEDAYRPPAVPPPPTVLPDQVHVSGALDRQSVALNNVTQEVVRAELAVTVGDGVTPEFGTVPSPNLLAFDDTQGPTVPLRFHLRAATALPLAGWRLLLEDEATGELVYALDGNTLPTVLDWNGRQGPDGPQVLASGHSYLATLAAVATNGDVGVSAPRRLGVRVGPVPESKDADSVLDEASGVVFNADDSLDRTARAWLRSQFKQQGSVADLHVRVEVHGDDQATPLTLKHNRARADRVKQELVALGVAPERVEATGLGGEQPAVPNMGRAQRALNRRVVVRWRKASPLGEALPPFATVPAARVNDRDVPVDERGGFQTDIPAHVGDQLRVDLTDVTGQRVVLNRLYTGKEFAAGAPPPPGSAPVDVQGDTVASTVQVGPDVVPAGSAESVSITYAGNGTSVALNTEDGVEKSLDFQVTAPPETRHWRMQVIRPVAQPSAADGGAAPREEPLLPALEPLVFEQSGDGAPPATLTWDGTSQLPLEPGVLRFRLVVELPAGVTAYSSDGTLVLRQPDRRVVIPDAFDPRQDILTKAGKPAVDAAVEQAVKAGGPVEVIVHFDDSVPKMRALFKTQAQAEQLKELLVAAGVPEASVTAVGRGADEPLVKGRTAKARAQNRRVEFKIAGAPPVEVPAQLPVPRAEVNGQPVPMVGSRFTARTFARPQEPLVVAWRTASGERRVVRPVASVVGAQGTPRTVADVLGPVPVRAPLSTTVVLPGGAARPVSNGEFVGWNNQEPPAESLSLVPGALVVTLAPRGEDAGTVNLDAVPDAGSVDWHPDPRHVPAADLVADLPPEGSVLRTERLLVRGMTHVANKVTVNGEPAVVDPVTGRFMLVTRLVEGPMVLKVEATDEQGNRGTLTRTCVVDTTGLFILAFADTAAGGAGAQMDELTQYNSIAPVYTPKGGFSLRNGPVVLYGRGVVYAKGKWHGFWRIPFIEATLHLDTARWAEPWQSQDILNPDIYYPTFGDNGVEIQEARARYPVFARLKAGDNEVYVGNGTAQLTNADLFRYSRARYTGMATVDQGYVKLDKVMGVDLGHTRARLMVAGGDTPRRPAHLELRGTGGSLFFLKDRDIIEGSERVYVVVRDAITGMELMRVLKSRNVDYDIRYREGRLVMTEPLPSSADSSYITNNNPTAVTTGNPVFLVVDYEHEGKNDFSEVAIGGTAEQTALDHVAVGGGYVLEGRQNHSPSYQLLGAHARAWWDQDNYVQAEWAYSRSINVENAISNDGGLSYQPYGQGMDTNATVSDGRLYPSERQGHAFKLKGQASLGKLLLHKAPGDLAVRTYFQRVESGFFADGSMTDQGQWKYGAEGNWQISRKDRARVRWDGVWSEVPIQPLVLQYRQLHREIAIAQLQHREGPFTLTGEYAFSCNEDNAKFGVVHYENFKRYLGNIVALQVDWQVFDRLVLFGRQEGAITADPQLAPKWNDRLTTTAGARFKLLDNLALEVSEAVKWNGENATNVGLRTRVDQNTELYATERFQYRQDTWVSTSILGASSEPAKGSRTYAEYQVDNSWLGGQTRSVMGASHQWTLMEGLTLGLGYERTEVLGSSSQGYGPATANPNGTPVPAAFSDSYAYATPGATGAQAPILGSGSRDAMHVQLGFHYWKWLKINSRLEMRYDNADEKRGGYDRLIFFTTNELAWNWTEDLSFIGRFNLADVQNRTLNLQEAALQELVAGLAYRPVNHEWLSVVTLLRHRLELRPIMLGEGRFERTTSDVASLEPILELPFGLQFAEKLAFKLSREKADGMPEGSALMVLWVNRANYHAFRMLKRVVPWFNRMPGDIDVALEYRLRSILTTGQLDHGVVTELGLVPIPYVRLGIGFNFSRVSDDEFAKTNQNAFGPYVRLQAQY